MSNSLAWWMDDRRAELGMTWDDVAAAAQVSTETLHRARGGRSMRTTTKKAIESALQWQPGSVESIAAGGNPASAAVDPGPSVDERIERLQTTITDLLDQARGMQEEIAALKRDRQ